MDDATFRPIWGVSAGDITDAIRRTQRNCQRMLSALEQFEAARRERPGLTWAELSCREKDELEYTRNDDV